MLVIKKVKILIEPVTPYLKALDAINPMDSAFYNALSAGITGTMVGYRLSIL